MTPQLNLQIPAADQLTLATDVYLPAKAPAPVIVTRTPYSRSQHLAEGLAWARRGFAFVVQDVRGRYDSAGTWAPYRHERADGAALARWVHKQPWCDGFVVAAGASYGAYTAWALAISEPAVVRGVISMVPAMGIADVKFDPGGILRLSEHAGWWVEHGDSRTSRTDLAATMFAAEPRLLHHLPVAELDRRMWPELPGWWPAVAQGPDMVEPESISEAELAHICVPSLHVGGWYDLLIPDTLHHWRITGGALVVGPWDHQLHGVHVGARHHGPAAGLSLGSIQTAWISAVRSGLKPTSVRLFMIGNNQWWDGDSWPQCADKVLYAHADGSLREVEPSPGQRSFRSDPANPFPSRREGEDRADLTTRTDAVRFVSLPMSITIVGRPVVVLPGDIDAPSGDWVVRLLQRNRDGTVLSLAVGAVDTARVDGLTYEITLTPIVVTLSPDSALELEITGADFPHLARNLQTGLDRYTTTRMQAANYTVHCGPGGLRVSLPSMEH